MEEKNIINYNFHRIEVSLDENYNVYSITIHNENLNNKIGDYPIITVEEAKNRGYNIDKMTVAGGSPRPAAIPEGVGNVTVIAEPATVGVRELIEKLKNQ